MGEDKVLIANIDGRDRLHIKVRRKMKSGFAPNEYCKVLNTRDANDLALLFEDLNIIIGAPIDKAFRIYKEKKDKGFPF